MEEAPPVLHTIKLTHEQVIATAGMFINGLCQLRDMLEPYINRECRTACQAEEYLHFMVRTIGKVSDIMRLLPVTPAYFMYLECERDTLVEIQALLKVCEHTHENEIVDHSKVQ